LGWLRHAYHKRLGRHARFHLAVLLTIVVATYLLVPWIVSLIDAGRVYSPTDYEPKDFSRQQYLARHGLPVTVVEPWKVALNIILVLLIVILWMTLLPAGGARRR
jgi:hypothetical protein